MERTGAELIVESLKAEGVKVLFGLPGSENLPIVGRLLNFTDAAEWQLVDLSIK